MSTAAVKPTPEKTAKPRKKRDPSVPRKRLAYEVSEDHEGNAEIVWAKSTAEARREAMGELNAEFSQLSTKRIPELDDFKGDIDQWKFNAGWWSTCHYQPCHKEQCSEDNGAVYRDGIWACCDEHVTLEQERRVKEKARKTEVIAEALRIKPGSTVHNVHLNPDGTPILDMTFPSGVRRCHTFLDWLSSEEGQKA
jgi:hypothetical protein